MAMNWNRVFQQKLLQWYERQQRILPWRGYDDPYAIWVSEIMLQQTRVEAVLPYFQRFMAIFPTVQALAEAEQEEVLKLWEGLGYYSRARNLHQAAQVVVEEYAGQVPNTYGEVLKLPGVGPYTAGAILSIAFNQPFPAVDGNVKRVFSRLFAIPDDVKKGSVKKRIERLAEEAIPKGLASDFNQALMELGALVCIPKSPRCGICPVQELCAGFAEGEPAIYPVKSAKREPLPMVKIVALVRRGYGAEEQILLMRNPAKGMLAGLWAFPGIDLTHGEWNATGVGQQFATQKKQNQAQLTLMAISEESCAVDIGGVIAEDREQAWGSVCGTLIQYLSDELGVQVEVLGQIGETHHTFTHRVWTMPIIDCRLIEQQKKANTTLIWVTSQKFDDYAIPTVYQKVIKEIW